MMSVFLAFILLCFNEKHVWGNSEKDLLQIKQEQHFLGSNEGFIAKEHVSKA